MSGILAAGGAIAVTVQVLQWINQLVSAGTDAVTAWQAVSNVISEGRAPTDAEWALAVADMDAAHEAVQNATPDQPVPATASAAQSAQQAASAPAGTPFVLNQSTLGSTPLAPSAAPAPTPQPPPAQPIPHGPINPMAPTGPELPPHVRARMFGNPPR